MRAPGEGGAGGRQNPVGESLLRGQSHAGPTAWRAPCPSAAEQSSVFDRHIALVDWAVGRNLQRSYLIDFGRAAVVFAPLCASSGLTMVRSSARCASAAAHALSHARPRRANSAHPALTAHLGRLA